MPSDASILSICLAFSISLSITIWFCFDSFWYLENMPPRLMSFSIFFFCAWPTSWLRRPFYFSLNYLSSSIILAFSFRECFYSALIRAYFCCTTSSSVATLNVKNCFCSSTSFLISSMRPMCRLWMDLECVISWRRELSPRLPSGTSFFSYSSYWSSWSSSSSCSSSGSCSSWLSS